MLYILVLIDFYFQNFTLYNPVQYAAAFSRLVKRLTAFGGSFRGFYPAAALTALVKRLTASHKDLRAIYPAAAIAIAVSSENENVQSKKGENTMKQFEIGKRYEVNGGGTITVLKRTAKYIVFDGDYSGKRSISSDNLFNLGENILIPSDYPGMKYFCFAGHEAAANE